MRHDGQNDQIVPTFFFYLIDHVALAYSGSGPLIDGQRHVGGVPF